MDCIIHGVTKSWTRQSNFHFPGGSDGKESACNAGDPDSVPGSGRSPGEVNGSQLQYSCLENSMDREEAWRAYSSWGCQESDMTDELSTLAHSTVSKCIKQKLM